MKYMVQYLALVQKIFDNDFNERLSGNIDENYNSTFLKYIND